MERVNTEAKFTFISFTRLKLMLDVPVNFSSRLSLVNVTTPARNADLVTFTQEILNGKLHFLYSDSNW